MATRKESASLVKQKKVTSPSDHRQTSPAQTKRPSNTLKQSTSLSCSTTKVTQTASDKQIPNYLKPTLSSRVESPKPVTKKHVSLSPGASAQKPNLSRRNSFDKPHSSTQMQKIFTSTGSKERSLTVRTSSFSSQSSGSARPVMDRTLKTHKAGPVKSHASTIAGNKTTRKNPVSAPLTIEKETSELTGDQSNPDLLISDTENAESGNLDNKKQEVKDVEEVVLLEVESDHGIEVAPDFWKSEDIVEEQDDIILAGDELLKDQENLLDQTCVITTVDSIQDSSEFSPKVSEDTKDKLAEQEAVETFLGDKAREYEDQILSDQTNNIQEEASIEVVTPEDKMEDHGLEKRDTITAETEDAKAKSENPEQAGEEENQNKPMSSHDEKKDVPVEGTMKEEAKPLTIKTVTPSKSPASTQGNSKKDSPAYNDVIAETSSKLMEKRKNKVKALVGAFETVISLEEPQA